MTTTTTNTYDADAQVRADSLSDRLAHSGPVEGQVRVIGSDDESLLGREGRLARIDEHDSTLTFRVSWGPFDSDWVYEVEPVDPATPQAASAELSALREQVSTLQSTVHDVRRQLEAFKDAVRDKAIEVAEERGWCDEGLNDVLSELGLEPKTTKWTVTVRVFAYQDVELEIEAETEDDASEEALSEAETEVNDHGWEIDSGQDPEVQSTEQS